MAPGERVDFREWIGRTVSAADVITPGPLDRLAATLDRDEPPARDGAAVPPLGHWLYFLDRDRASDLGEEGHARLGRFMPPSALPRRMWAGSRLEFHRPLRVGDAVRRISTLTGIQEKNGRTGPLLFVTVKHEIRSADGLVLTDAHDIVYRDGPGPAHHAGRREPAPADGEWSRRIEPDPVLLFRYSALTFNGHRIHYDRNYATRVEGYPDLVVHGPLIATLLVDLLARERPGAGLARFAFRARSPLFVGQPFHVCGRPGSGGSVQLWAAGPEGQMAMSAEAELR
jgi:3-methylfumaryl-CoA hydratase